MVESFKEIIRRTKWLIRSVLGKDIYHRKQRQVPIRIFGGINGTMNGSWPVYTQDLNASSVIYSVGIGDDVSFDLDMINTLGVQIHAFDPTPASIQWMASQKLPEAFHPHSYGLADYDGKAEFLPPETPGHVSYSMTDASAQHLDQVRKTVSVEVRRLASLMDLLGHEAVDLLKMDIEGGEYSVITDLVSSGVKVKQLLVEFHHRMYGFKPADTQKAIQALNAAGYDIIYVSSRGEEYAFLKR